MSGCPSEETLGAFAEGRLEAAHRQALEAHLDGCGGCGQLIACVFSRSVGRGTEAGRLLPTAPTTPLRGFALARAEGDKFGRYVILGGMGIGGMGAVYAAYDTALERKVALKFLARGRSEETRRLLLAEASNMAQLKHTNVVTVYDAGVVDDEAFLAMELVEGQTLAAWSASERSVREIVNVMAGVARGLAAAHARGIVHRDVKPGNILVDGERALVTDFGLSVQKHARESSISGTPGYMAPEQWRGEPVDARTDVFAFCVTLYRLLYRVMPFEGDDLEQIFRAVMAGKLTPPPAGTKVSQRLHRLAISGLAVDPAQRPGDLNALADALLDDPLRTVRRAGLAAAGGLAILAAFWGGWVVTGRPERRCHAGASAIDASYAAGPRAVIRGRYQAAGLGTVFEAVDRRLLAYARDWRAMHDDTCKASFGERRQSEGMLDLRMMCLEDRRETLTAFSQTLTSAPATALATAAGAPLPDVSTCGVSGRGSTKPLPADPAARAQISAIQRELARARAGASTGDYRDARAAVTGALAVARKLGYEPTLAQALIQAAKIEGQQGNGQEEVSETGGAADNQAEKLYEEALAVAERGGDDREQATAAVDLVMVYAHADRYREAELWGKLAEASLGRIGNPVEARADLALNLGWLQRFRGDVPAARASFSRAVELRRSLPEVDAAALTPAMIARCPVLENDESRLACSMTTIPFVRDALGPRHPHLSVLYSDIAALLKKDPRTRPEACAYLQRGLEIKQAVLAPRHPNLINGLLNVGSCLQGLGRLAEAKRYYEDGLGRAVRRSTLRALARQNYAFYLWDVGQLDETVQYLRLAAEDRRALLGETHENTLRTRRNLAEVLLDQDKPAEALAEADEIISACARLATPPPYLQRVHATRAAALLRLGRLGQAAAAAEMSLDLQQRSKADADEQAAPLIVRGQARLQLGDRQRARTDFERALELRPAQSAEAEDRAEAAYFVARALAPPGTGPSPRACALAKEAAEAYRKASKAYTRERLDAEALWNAFAKRGC